MNRTLTAVLIASLASPSFAGGPVVLEEEEEVVEAAATSNIIVPLLLLLAVGVLVSNGSDPAAPPDCGSVKC